MTGIGLFVVRVELYWLMFINVIFPDRQVRDVKMFISVRDHDLDTFERRKKIQVKQRQFDVELPQGLGLKLWDPSNVNKAEN